MKVCFVMATSPTFLGGTSQYVNNLLLSGLFKKDSVTWIYKGRKDRKFQREGINFIEVKVPKMYLWNEILFNKKVRKTCEKEYFDVINTHAIWGLWLKKYKKKKGQRIVHTYHGSTHNFYSSHLKRFSFIKRLIFRPSLWFANYTEKPPIRYADHVIYVSNKIKKYLEALYGKPKKSSVIRTGVDLKSFNKRQLKESFKKTGLEKDKIYALFVGRGGYWTKGLDLAVKLGGELYNRNKDFRLITVGPDKEKTKDFINKPFVKYVSSVPRHLMPYYYSLSSFFFCTSRSEGGAPTMVVSEAIAGGDLIVCSKSSELEVIEDKKNGLIFEKFNSKDAGELLEVFKDKRRYDKMIKESQKILKELDLLVWTKKYRETFK